MNEDLLTKTGKLRNEFLPAIYFDSSVLIDYWLTDQMDLPETEEDELLKKNEPKYLEAMRNILNSENRIKKVAKIRERLSYHKTKVTAVVSPIALLELIEWKAEATFKQIASEASGTILIQRKGKKEIGDYLKETFETLKIRSEQEKIEDDKLANLRMLMNEIIFHKYETDELYGIQIVNITNFDLTIETLWKEPSTYSLMQVGVADIMHILFAQHLGCKYFASFDSDFARIKNIIKEDTGIEILTTPEEVLKIL